MDVGRRRVLGSLAGFIGVVAGCSGAGGDSTRTGTYVPPDVVVFNNTDSEQTAMVSVVVAGQDEPVVSETTDIEAKGAAEYPDPLPSSGEVTLSVEVTGGPSGEEEFSVASEDESVQAVIEGESIRFRKRSGGG